MKGDVLADCVCLDSINLVEQVLIFLSSAGSF